MAMRLGQQALARIDKQDGEIAIGGAGRHVSRILFMAGRIGDDERAARCRERAIGHIDCNSLLAFGLKSVDQQREVDVLADSAVLLRIAIERRELIVEDELLIVKQAADERRFSIIDRAAGQEPQRR